MRRLSLLFLFLLSCSIGSLSAQQRTETEALDIAKSFLQKKYAAGQDGIRRVPPLKSVIQRVPVDKKVETWNPFYIWNDEASNSFVIVSGDERMPEILGYASNLFEEEKIPDALSKLLSDYAIQYNALQKLPVASSSTDSQIASDESSEIVLETARWGQGKPFNEDCPENSAAGCVATAMSIVMRYHNWPLQGEGTNEYTWYGNEGVVTLSADFGNTVYDWENMPLDYENYTAEQGKAVAQLIYHAGVSVNMYYGYSASGANLYDVKSALTSYFRYNPRSFFIEAANYTKDEWLARLKQEINEGRPVLYGGTSENTQTGHAFVVDGYQNDLLHINWGWNGFYDGFFALGYLTPGDGMGGYNSEQIAIVNIKPYKEETEALSPVVLIREEGVGLVTANCRDVKKDVTFNFVIAAYSDYPRDGSYTGDYCVALVDREGNIKEIVGETQLFHNGNAIDISCRSSQDAVSGDYLCLFTRQTGTEELLPVMMETGGLARVPALGNEPPTINFTWDDPDQLLQTANFQPSEFEGKPILGSSLFYQVRIPDGCICKAVASDGSITVLEGDGFGEYFWLKDNMTVKLSLIDMDNRIENLNLHIATPGTLEQTALAACADFDQVKSLILSGKMDDRDFLWLSKNKLLEGVDLSQVEIVASETNSAHRIPDHSFEGFKLLKSCVMPIQLTEIGNNAFAQTGLESVVIPATVVSIGLNAFWCSFDLREVTVKNPEPVWISWCVFTGTSREKGTLHVPQGCLDVYRNASEWNMFQEIIDDIPNEVLSFSVDGIYYQNIPGYVDQKYARVIAPPEGAVYSGNLQIPEFVVYEGEKYVVREIGPKAFYNSENLISLSMSDSIRIIGESSVEFCTSLERVRLSDNIEVLPQYALGYLPKLKEVNLPESLVRIERYALYRNQIESLHFPKGLSYVDPTALTQMYKLKEITVDPDNSNFAVEEGLLVNKEKNKLLLRPEMLASGEFEVPSFVSVIGGYSISGNELSRIIIPESVVRLEAYSISGCHILKDIYSLSSIPPFADENSFDSWCLENVVLKVPVGAKAAYQLAVGWGGFYQIEEFDEIETSVSLSEEIGLKIESVSGGIQVYAESPIDYSLYSFNGILLKQGRLHIGLNRISLGSKGNFILKSGNRVYKISVRF